MLSYTATQQGTWALWAPRFNLPRTGIFRTSELLAFSWSPVFFYLGNHPTPPPTPTLYIHSQMPVITTLRIHNILYPGTLLPAQGSFSLCLDWPAVFALLCLSLGHVLAQCQCETAVPERQGQACATREEWLPILQGQLRPSAWGEPSTSSGPLCFSHSFLHSDEPGCRCRPSHVPICAAL